MSHEPVKGGELVRISAESCHEDFRSQVVRTDEEYAEDSDRSGGPCIVISGEHKGRRIAYVYYTPLSPLEQLAHCAEGED